MLFRSLVATLGTTWRDLDELAADAVIDFLYQLDAIRKEERFRLFNDICSDIYGQRSEWLQLRQAAASVKAKDVGTAARGKELGTAIRAEQVLKIQALLADEG